MHKIIHIIDYGIGNLGSISNMLKKIGVKAVISSDENLLSEAEKLILPGVGHFDYGMKNLNDSGLREMLDKKVLHEKTPILGICLGAQLLLSGSEEGIEPGLAYIEGESTKFVPEKFDSKLPVPHMGWTTVKAARQHSLVDNFEDDERYYFVHSYEMKVKPENQLITADYGYPFTAGIVRENVLGVQFHPEKSHRFGMKLLQNFAEI